MIAIRPGLSHLALGLLAVIALAAGARAQADHYSYQGRLTQGGLAATGQYDLRFRVYTDAGGDILLVTSYADDHPVTNGVFTAEVPIAPVYSGASRWIEVSVRPGSVSNSDRSEASYTKLNPRQEIAPTPYALYAYEAGGLRLPIDESLNLLGVNFKITNNVATAIWGETDTGFGVTAKSGSGIALYAASDAGGWAGVFQGPLSANDRIAINYGNSTTLALACNGSAAKPGGGSWSVLSDERMKQDIEPLRGALDRVLQLQGYTFAYTPAALERGLALPGPQIGLVAQQVERVFPDWVDEDGDGTKMVTERGTTALFVEALRELRAEKDRQIEALQQESQTLQRELETLRAEVAALRTGAAR